MRRLKMVGAVALAVLAGNAMAQRRGQPEPVPVPQDSASAGLAPDDAAERLIRFCADSASGSAPQLDWAMKRRFDTLFPGLSPGLGLGRDGQIKGPLYIDVRMEGRLFVTVHPQGTCFVSADDGGLDEPMKAAFGRQLAKSGFTHRAAGFWVWKRSGPDLDAVLRDALRIYMELPASDRD